MVVSMRSASVIVSTQVSQHTAGLMKDWQDAFIVPTHSSWITAFSVNRLMTWNHTVAGQIWYLIHTALKNDYRFNKAWELVYDWLVEQKPHDDVIKWNHFSALQALCEGNPQVTGGFLSQRPVTRSFDVFFDLRLNKWLSKHSRRRWFETPSRSLWRHRNEGRKPMLKLMAILMGLFLSSAEPWINIWMNNHSSNNPVNVSKLQMYWNQQDAANVTSQHRKSICVRRYFAFV